MKDLIFWGVSSLDVMSVLVLRTRRVRACVVLGAYVCEHACVYVRCVCVCALCACLCVCLCVCLCGSLRVYVYVCVLCVYVVCVCSCGVCVCVSKRVCMRVICWFCKL